MLNGYVSTFNNLTRIGSIDVFGSTVVVFFKSDKTWNVGDKISFKLSLI